MGNKIYGNAPFTKTDEMVDLANCLRSSDDMSTARSIFDWMQGNINYDDSAKGILGSISSGYCYKSAHEVFESGRGICLDQAYLYNVLARCAGISSSVVEVTVNYNGKSVYHACNYVGLRNRSFLVDTSYNKFDVDHEEYEVMSDSDVIDEYYSIDHCYEDGNNSDDEEDSSDNYNDNHSDLESRIIMPTFGTRNIPLYDVKPSYFTKPNFIDMSLYKPDLIVKPQIERFEYSRDCNHEKPRRNTHNGIDSDLRMAIGLFGCAGFLSYLYFFCA